MPSKKKPKGTNNAGSTNEKRELLFKEDGQEYGRVTAMLGNRRVSLQCMDGLNRIGIIRGSMKRGSLNRIHMNDFVLCGLREYQKDKCDIIHRFNDDEVRRLKGLGEIDKNVKLNQDIISNVDNYIHSDDDGGIEFDFSDGDIENI